MASVILDGGDRAIAMVGIFWGVPARDGSLALAIDQTPLVRAETYGEFLTHSQGHYEVWEAWRHLGTAGLILRRLPPAIVWHEYEECPRGRIVYGCPQQKFTVYADRRLQAPTIIARIIRAFGLEDQRWAVRSDSHYR